MAPLLHRAAIKTEMLRRNGPVVKSVESVLRLAERESIHVRHGRKLEM